MASKTSNQKYSSVPGNPVKSFFVEMLTRDISLADSILDLLDNCIDGLLRTSTKSKLKSKKPYSGYSAEIKFDGHSFEISDNCGGIPWDLHDYAFRMGRSGPLRDKSIPTVGVYGIGMKRAMFKIGRRTLLHTQNSNDNYEVEITPSWLASENDWTIPVSGSASKRKEDGTTIVIGDLHPDIKAQFDGDKALFQSDLTKKIATHYAFIINKGFSVTVNGKRVKPQPTELKFDSSKKRSTIKPYIYKNKIDGVDIFLAVGFTGPIPSQEDVIDEQEKSKYSSMDAGWTDRKSVV